MDAKWMEETTMANHLVHNLNRAQDYRFCIINNSRPDHLSSSIESLRDVNTVSLKHNICIVSIVGQSSLGQNSCKANLVDDALKKTVFAGLFGDQMQLDSDMLTEIEGFYDCKSRVLFLHLISSLDADTMYTSLQSFKEQIRLDNGFLQVWPSIQFNACKSLLLLFLVSHIVIVHHPTLQFDLSWMPTFRTLEQMRRHVLPDIQKVLESCGDLSSSWIQSGRLCSPRVLFTFNGSNDRLFEHDSKTSNPITVDRRKYELQMEDQLYRTLRNCRVITNICNNSLFAICNQVDFVFITRTTDHRAGVDTFFESLVDQFIDDFSNNISAFRKIEKSFEHQPRKLHTNFDQSAQTFFDFLWKHVDMALTKGFDDNVGKHNVGAYFQLPTLQSFLNVLCSMSSHFFKQNQTESELNNNLQNKLGKLLQIDRNFSQSFCVKVLNAAFAFYKENLPKNYPLQIHERKLNQSLQLFASLARGEATYHYAQILQSDCENYWRSGRQICSSRSLFSKYCALPLHEVPDLLELLMSNDDKTDTGKLLQHCSGIKYVSTCNCGLRQTNREDPFTVAEANWLFYRNLAQKCRCKDMQKVQFPIFCGSIDEARSVNVMLNQMMKMGFQKAVRDEKRDENDAPEEDEEYEDYEDNKYGDLHDNPVSSKRESEFLSQEFGNANAFKSQSGLGNDDSDSGRSLVGDREDEDEEDDDEVDPDEEEEDDYDDEEEGDDESANAFEAKLLNDKLIDRRNRVRRMSLVVESSPSKSKLICNEVTNEMQEDITCYSTDKYLLSMRNTLSPPNLLPLFCSWSLVRLGSSSVYSHNLGIQDQPGFLSGSHYLLPWNVNVKLEHCTELPSLWQGKYPPGIKNKKMFADGISFTVKIFFGFEYECMNGHRFISSRPGHRQKWATKNLKESANLVATSDMPLYIQCVCSRRQNERLAQLIRLHVVTPKAPVLVTLRPQVQPTSGASCPIYFPTNQSVKLAPASYWVLRLPFVYQCESTSTEQRIYSRCREQGHFLAHCFGISDQLDDSHIEYISGYTQNTS